MEKLGLISCQVPGHIDKKTGDEHVEIPNYLDRQFNVDAPNKVWCGDITYIWTGNRWAYLAVVIDLFARKPVGWAISLSLDSELTSKRAEKWLMRAVDALNALCFIAIRAVIIRSVNFAKRFGSAR